MAPTPSIKVVKHTPYRGATQTWSNRYHFAGASGLTTAQWTTLADALATDESYLYPASTSIVSCVGYEAGSDVPVFSKAYAQAGTAAYDASDISCPGDVAALVRFGTTQRTSKNHPVYLFNYYHAAFHETGLPDTISAQMKLAIEGYATWWLSGHYAVGGAPIYRAGPHGAVAQNRLVETYLTHRDFPR